MRPDQLREGLASFEGLKRRQEIRGEAGGVIVVDDFAHHPTAVRETTQAVADRWPDRRLVAVFEPRSNSSRRKVFESAYAEAFDCAAAVFISAPPIRHNDHLDDLLDEAVVVGTIQQRGIAAEAFTGADELLPHLLDALKPGDVALIMSNGAFGGIHERLLQGLGRTANSA